LVLREPTHNDRVLYADEGRGFLLILNYDYDDASNTIDTRTDMTWAAYLALKGGIDDPLNLKLSDYRYAQQGYNLSPRRLTETIDWEYTRGAVEVHSRARGRDLLILGATRFAQRRRRRPDEQ
jgi:hypothetical protein